MEVVYHDVADKLSLGKRPPKARSTNCWPADVVTLHVETGAQSRTCSAGEIP